VIRVHQANGADYTSNCHHRSYPDGMDAQVFTRAALETSSSLTEEPLDREHVTLHIRNNPETFRQVHILAPPSLHWPELGLTLDEPADFTLISRIIEHFGPARPNFSCGEVLTYLRSSPELLTVNSHVSRRGAS
jgi:spore coat polysaccharide biosynthesis protein SpsF